MSPRKKSSVSPNSVSLIREFFCGDTMLASAVAQQWTASHSARLARIETALSMEDFSQLELELHGLSGGVLLFGSKAIVDQINLLLESARQKDFAHGATLLRQIKDSCQGLEKTLSELILVDDQLEILVADNDPVAVTHIAGIIRSAGYQVYSCSDGISALTEIQNNPKLRIAILDWMMPGLSGTDICRQIRNQQDRLSIHLILLTVRDTPEDISLAFQSGASDFIAKPFTPQELIARIRVGAELTNLRNTIASLSKLIPICAWCTKIRDEAGDWLEVSDYFEKIQKIPVTHTACANCLDKLKSK